MPNPEIWRYSGKGGAGNRGRKQSPEHVRNRVAATQEAISKLRRACVVCSEEFTPTRPAQRYCTGRCWMVVAQRRRVRKKALKVPAGLFAEMQAGQANKCAICGCEGGSEDNRGDRLAVDHDHETGVVRGLLCHKCNTAIGLLRDDPEVLRRAADYLDRPPFNIEMEVAVQC